MLEIIIIFLVAAAIFAGITWYTRRSNEQQMQVLDDSNNIEPELGDSEQLGAMFEEELENQQIIDTDKADIDVEPQITSAKKQVEEPKEEEKVAADNEMMLAFTVIARDGELFSGRSVKATLEYLDLHFGDFQMYHRVGEEKASNLFSVANVLTPGTLNPNDFATMKTPGLLLFAQLPGPVEGLTLFDGLIDTAQKMAEELGGVLSDEARNPIEISEIEEIRKQVLSLDL